ncbi:neuromedin-U [Tenrec ecaudatus]|uniref:neuromedin-U n=1 Tax=Tenrec ecaudatus TaxID=94439 RepID=UPI003F5AD48F
MGGAKQPVDARERGALNFTAPAALEELCLLITGMLRKPQESYEKDNTKRTASSALSHSSPEADRALGSRRCSAVFYSLAARRRAEGPGECSFNIRQRCQPVKGGGRVLLCAANSQTSSVVHPLLQLIPQLQERRMKRFKVGEEFPGPVAIRSRGYFLFRPRNGRRSGGFS